MKFFIACFTVLLLATAAQARDELSGRITAIDPAKETLEISGVTIDAKGADIQGLLFSRSLSKYKVGEMARIEGRFSGPREMKATKVEKKIFEHFEIEAVLDEVDARARTLKISGITVKVPEGVKIEDIDGKRTTLDKLANGQKVEVEGEWSGPAEFTAAKVEMKKNEKKEQEKD